MADPKTLRGALSSAWNDLPDVLRCHPGLKRYNAAVNALAAQAQAQAEPVAVPQSWKLVPIKPTRAMMRAAKNADMDHSTHAEWMDVVGDDLLLMWAAMLAAAPQPAQAATAVSDDDIRRVFLANGFTIKPGQSDLKGYVFAAARALLAEANQQPARSERIPLTDSQREALLVNMMLHGKMSKHTARQILALVLDGVHPGDFEAKGGAA
ncbi:hypothetical protein [Ideonella livida]|uniref:Uncharacterized protein n=1 Tax=Ideonella livida TaxID=2707176 RepID=A0A7C9PEG6_9BURK|nr:hypothetical protein [Ideonella livida]NDY89715.1 hypothetical protein [Ideonella livida]